MRRRQGCRAIGQPGNRATAQRERARNSARLAA